MSEYRYVYKTSSSQTKNKSGIGKKIFITVLCALIFGAVAFTTFYCLDINFGKKETIEFANAGEVSSFTAVSSTDIMPGSVTAEKQQGDVVVTDVSAVVERSMPGVVAITSTQIYEDYRNYGYFRMGSGETYEVSGAGSGVIFNETDDTFYIVTNHHVIADATSLTVTLNDGSTVAASVIGFNKDKDLAIIAIQKSDMTESSINSTKMIERGDSDSLKVGESVIAIGNALGYGQSVTTGIVSALNREVKTQNADGSLSSRLLIQTDAAINPGNSGGALLDADGRLIGINSMKYSSEEVEGMGYAIPINEFEKELESLMAGAGITSNPSEQIPQQNEMTQEDIQKFFEYYFS